VSSEATAARPVETLEAFRAMIGGPPQASAWMLVDQARIDGFALHTGDDAFIHTDPGRAAGTRFGGAIAHGLLSLSLLPRLLRTAMPALSDARMGVNYGFDRVRFLAPVPVNSELRAHVAIKSVTDATPGFVRIAHHVSVEIAGGTRPALVANWILGYWV